MRCVYKTTSRRDITFYGDGTQAEMCFGFLTVYPNILTGEDAACLDWAGTRMRGRIQGLRHCSKADPGLSPREPTH